MTWIKNYQERNKEKFNHKPADKVIGIAKQSGFSDATNPLRRGISIEKKCAETRKSQSKMNQASKLWAVTNSKRKNQQNKKKGQTRRRLGLRAELENNKKKSTKSENGFTSKWSKQKNHKSETKGRAKNKQPRGWAAGRRLHCRHNHFSSKSGPFCVASSKVLKKKANIEQPFFFLNLCRKIITSSLSLSLSRNVKPLAPFAVMRCSIFCFFVYFCSNSTSSHYALSSLPFLLRLFIPSIEIYSTTSYSPKFDLLLWWYVGAQCNFFSIVPWNRGIFRYSMECSMEFHAHRRESVRNKNGNWNRVIWFVQMSSSSKSGVKRNLDSFLQPLAAA